MRKSDKKTENQIRDVLTDVCEGYVEKLRWLSMGDSFGQLLFIPAKFKNRLCIRHQSG